MIYDQAAGHGKTRAEVERASKGQTQLVSQLPPYEKRSARFGPYDFSLAQAGAQLTCPNEKISQVAYRSGSGDGCDFRFFDFQCWSGEPPIHMNAKRADLSKHCPVWEQCRDNRQVPRSMRQVFISDYREQVLAAQCYNQSDDFRQEMNNVPWSSASYLNSPITTARANVANAVLTMRIGKPRCVPPPTTSNSGCAAYISSEI